MSHQVNGSLSGKTIFITGASRGIGRAIALKCAQDGANLVIAAKSDTAHPKLPGTIHSVAAEIEEHGGKALAIRLDVRDDDAVIDAVNRAGEHFGGIDAIINNAGAIKLANTETLPLKRFDLMTQINSRAVLSCSKAALPWLKRSNQAHILSLSPPINLDPKWFANYGPYTVTKYGMTMLSIGMAEEYRRHGISVSTLWPQTIISTAAIEFEGGGKSIMELGRTTDIMADAAYEILSTTDGSVSGKTLIDESLLRERGITDFDRYRYDPQSSKPLANDLFLN